MDNSGTGGASYKKTLTTAVNCKEEGHCLHEGTAIGSCVCCKCGEYVQVVAERLSFYEQLGGHLKAEIEAHPEWNAKLL